MAKFTVSRSKWYRGKDGRYSKLLLDDFFNSSHSEMRCCIGFVAQQVGVADGKCNVAIIRDMDDEAISLFPDWMQNKDLTEDGRNTIHEAYRVNDSVLMSDDVREARLKEIFLANGDEIEFIN